MNSYSNQSQINFKVFNSIIYTVRSKFNLCSVVFLASTLLASCGSVLNNTPVANADYSRFRIQDEFAISLVLDESKANAVVYVHNITEQPISGIKYNITNKNNLAMENQLLQINLDQCSIIPAKTHCLLSFKTSNLWQDSNTLLESSYRDMSGFNYDRSDDYTLEVLF